MCYMIRYIEGKYCSCIRSEVHTDHSKCLSRGPSVLWNHNMGPSVQALKSNVFKNSRFTLFYYWFKIYPKKSSFKIRIETK